MTVMNFSKQPSPGQRAITCVYFLLVHSFPWTHRCRQDALFGPRFFCDSLNAPPSLPKLSSPLGLIADFSEELRLSRSS